MAAHAPAETRFWRFVDKTDTCWLWTGAIDREGYGQFRVGYGPERRLEGAHRFSYEMANGVDLATRIHLDHTCRVRHCVNPEHLHPLSQRGNWLRGQSPTRANAEKTMCPQGHPYDRIGKNGIGRQCSICRAHRRRKLTEGFHAQPRQPMPSKETLEALLAAGTTWCALGKMHGVSDNAVRKWARKYKILPGVDQK